MTKTLLTLDEEFECCIKDFKEINNSGYYYGVPYKADDSSKYAKIFPNSVYVPKGTESFILSDWTITFILDNEDCVCYEYNFNEDFIAATMDAMGAKIDEDILLKENTFLVDSAHQLIGKSEMLLKIGGLEDINVDCI